MTLYLLVHMMSYLDHIILQIKSAKFFQSACIFFPTKYMVNKIEVKFLKPKGLNIFAPSQFACC